MIFWKEFSTCQVEVPRAGGWGGCRPFLLQPLPSAEVWAHTQPGWRAPHPPTVQWRGDYFTLRSEAPRQKAAVFPGPVAMATEASCQTRPFFAHRWSLIDRSNSVNRQTSRFQSQKVTTTGRHFVRVHVWVCVCVSVCVCVCVHMSVCMSVSVRMCMCVCTHV